MVTVPFDVLAETHRRSILDLLLDIRQQLSVGEEVPLLHLINSRISTGELGAHTKEMLQLTSNALRNWTEPDLETLRNAAGESHLLKALKVTDPGREIWKWVAAAVLALLLAEIWLSGWITRSRHGEAIVGVRFGQGQQGPQGQDGQTTVHTVR